MPTYDYRCTVCGRMVEVAHGIHESGPNACASCGAAMRKAVSPPAIHFRGGGWAKKDARSASAAKAGAGSSSTTSAASDPTSGASDGAASDGSPKDRSREATAGSDSGSTATPSERAATKTANSSE